MRRTTCTCDRCGKSITNGVVYSLTCYAEDVEKMPFGGHSDEVGRQNMRQNMALMNSVTKDLCAECKDALTDGIFIL